MTEFEQRVKSAVLRIGTVSKTVALDGTLSRAEYFDMVLRDVQHQERVAAIQSQTEQLARVENCDLPHGRK